MKLTNLFKKKDSTYDYWANPKCAECPYGQCAIICGKRICNKSAREFMQGRRNAIYYPTAKSYCIYNKEDFDE